MTKMKPHHRKRRAPFSSLRGSAALLLAALSLRLVHGEVDAPQAGILYFVNTASDTVVAGACANGLPNCSLRGAIQAANSHPGEDGIEIELPAGLVFIDLNSALPDITEGVSIMGAGPDKLAVRRNAGGNYRIFTVNAPGTVSFTGMTINNGSTGTGGGLAVNQGTVNVLNTVITGNAAVNGGGIANFGILKVTNSLIAGNSALSLGGGIQNDGSFTLTNSTITGNTARLGGGAYFLDGSVVLSNSTICRNDAENMGGGVYTQDSHPVTKSTIIALNTSAGSPDLFGDFSSLGFNLIGISATPGSFTQLNDQTGTLNQPLDPKLDPNGLQFNGGQTKTVALLVSSPAIDQGTSNGVNGNLATDQRGTGFARALDYSSVANAVGGDGADVGAVEFGGPLVPINVSRKMHGVLPFDIPLPLRGSVEIECRTGGPSGNHQLIMNFPAPVSLSSASVTTGTGSVSNHSFDGSNVIVNLTGVTNAQTIALTLFGVNGGATTSNVSVPMAVLAGDVTGNGTVNASDIGQAKAASGQSATSANFRADVNVNGTINASDIGLVKANSGTALP